MSPSLSVAANLPPDIRQKLAIEVLAKSKPVSHLATENKVSRKFLHLQGVKAKKALTECFEPTTADHYRPFLFADHQSLANPTHDRAGSHLPLFKLEVSLNCFAICSICPSASGRSTIG